VKRVFSWSESSMWASQAMCSTSFLDRCFLFMFHSFINRTGGNQLLHKRNHLCQGLIWNAFNSSAQRFTREGFYLPLNRRESCYFAAKLARFRELGICMENSEMFYSYLRLLMMKTTTKTPATPPTPPIM
jgi:hypothetical protein